MRSMFRRSLCAIALLSLMTVGLVPAATAAGASPQNTLKLHFAVDVTTHIAAANQDVTVPTGTFKGKLDTASGAVTGQLVLPPATTTISLAGIGLATATMKLAQTQPVVGQLDIHTAVLTSTSTFNIYITSLYAAGVPINLVGSRCRTVQPVVLTVSGGISIFGPFNLTGTYTIPQFANCQLATTPINLLIPGPNNTANAKFTPIP